MERAFAWEWARQEFWSGKRREIIPDQTDPIDTLDPDHLLRLGECVRDLIVRLGYGYDASDLSNRLFREVVAEAFTTLTNRQQMREFRREHSADALPDVSPISMEYLAQTVIDHTASHGISPPPREQEQLACIEVALRLDSTCSDPTFRSLKTRFWILINALYACFARLLPSLKVLEKEDLIYFLGFHLKALLLP